MQSVAHDSRGRLLYEYKPPRAHPIVYAGLILFIVVFATGSLENFLRENVARLYWIYAAPALVILGFYGAFFPNPVRIYEGGIQPSRPLLLRWRRPFIRWEEVEAAFPSFYDVTGAFVSPFASSDGKVTQMGLGMELADGARETIRFTPTRFTLWQAESAGYEGALGVVREIFAQRGRALTPASDVLPREQRQALLEEASKPFLPFIAIVLLFASAAPLLFILAWIGVPVPAALGLCLIPPAGVSLRSYVQSRRRHAILNRLSKMAEYERGLAS